MTQVSGKATTVIEEVIGEAFTEASKWTVETDGSTVRVTLNGPDGTEIATRRRFYKDPAGGQDPFDISRRLMDEIRLEIRSNAHRY